MNRRAGAQGSNWFGRAVPITAVVLAGLLQLVAGWFTLASGLLAPLWAIVVLGVLWLVATVLLVRIARRQPLAAILVPIAYGLLWAAALSAGEAWLGWTA